MTATRVEAVGTQRTRNGWQQVVAEGRVVASYRRESDAATLAVRLRHAARVLDRHMPLRGPCGLCGGPLDQTHRVIDSIAGMAKAEIRSGALDWSWVATEFGYTEQDSAAITDACLLWVLGREKSDV